MKLIFLDIDGVLNCTGTFVGMSEHPEFSSRELSREKVLLLQATMKMLEKEVGEMPKLVLSSTWRRMFTCDEMNEMFEKECGWTLPKDVWLGRTPEDRSGGRALEIQTYLEDVDEEEDKIDFVILDDHDYHWTNGEETIPGIRETFGDKFIQTSSFYGFSTPEANRVLRAFGCKQHFVVLI